METIETKRQQQIGKQIRKDIAEIFQKEASHLVKGVLATVTAVRVSPDFGYAKVYVSVFPFDKAPAVMTVLEDNNWLIRKELGARIKHQLKIVPELQFFLDDSLEYIESIERAMES